MSSVLFITESKPTVHTSINLINGISIGSVIEKSSSSMNWGSKAATLPNAVFSIANSIWGTKTGLEKYTVSDWFFEMPILICTDGVGESKTSVMTLTIDH
jgi:hypothetical protein